MNPALLSRLLRRAAALGTAALVCSAAPTANAWDPSTTHAGMTTRALTDSAVHLRWMEGSELSRGLFTGLKIDPQRLDDDLRRRIELAQRRAHADSGAQGLGGPGACPGVAAPASTRTRCVDGDQWEATALGWVALGVVAEVTPRERILHHFSNEGDAKAKTWTAGRGVPKNVLRAAQRRGDGPGLATVTGTAFSGTTGSAAGWLSDPQDPWAPPAMFEHLRKASMLADPAARQHHLALGLIGLGALLHVLQDSSVPAHARGDLAAFLAPLSATPGDRGLPLAEYARVLHGRAALPTRLPLSPRDAEPRRGVVLGESLLAHLAGGSGAYEGLAVTAGSRFLSEGSLPEPLPIDPGLSGQEAAAVLLADSGLAPSELDGAALSGWPAESGYVLSSQGRPLAGYAVDRTDRVQLHLDRRVYRDQIGQLVPLAIDASRSVIDLVFPAWPAITYQAGGNVLEVDTADVPGTKPELSILIEDRSGKRRLHRTVKLAAKARRRIIGAVPTVADQERVVLVLRATIGAHRLTTESLLARPDAPASTAEPTKGALAPAVRATPAELTPEADAPPPTDGTVQPPPGVPGELPPSQTPPSQPPADGSGEQPPSQPPADGSGEQPPTSAVPGTVPGDTPPGGSGSTTAPRGSSPGVVPTPKQD